jgi:hypothetical protein
VKGYISCHEVLKILKVEFLLLLEVGRIVGYKAAALIKCRAERKV